VEDGEGNMRNTEREKERNDGIQGRIKQSVGVKTKLYKEMGPIRTVIRNSTETLKVHYYMYLYEN